MLESTPRSPYTVTDLPNMCYRRAISIDRTFAHQGLVHSISSYLEPNEIPLTFSRLGVPGVFTDPHFDPKDAVSSHGLFFPEEITNPHVRFPFVHSIYIWFSLSYWYCPWFITLTGNISARRGSNLTTSTPIFFNEMTPHLPLRMFVWGQLTRRARILQRAWVQKEGVEDAKLFPFVASPFERCTTRSRRTRVWRNDYGGNNTWKGKILYASRSYLHADSDNVVVKAGSFQGSRTRYTESKRFADIFPFLSVYSLTSPRSFAPKHCVRTHLGYEFDSVVNQETAYDLMMTVNDMRVTSIAQSLERGRVWWIFGVVRENWEVSRVFFWIIMVALAIADNYVSWVLKFRMMVCISLRYLGGEIMARVGSFYCSEDEVYSLYRWAHRLHEIIELCWVRLSLQMEEEMRPVRQGPLCPKHRLQSPR